MLQKINRWLNYQFRKEAILVAIILFSGSLLRIIHLFIVGIKYPYRDGGLFLEFANQIALNNYRIPSFIPYYTNGGIPFAYPPLPFYFEAIGVYALGINAYAVVNLLPPFVSILSLASFYFLTSVVGLNQYGRYFALLAFAFLPSAFLQQIEGAGLAESFGTLALIWFLFSLFKAKNHPNVSSYIRIGVFWAICVVSSPGSAYASFLAFLIFSAQRLLQGNVARNVPNLIIGSGVAIVLSRPILAYSR